jgi:hypothetical protein
MEATHDWLVVAGKGAMGVVLTAGSSQSGVFFFLVVTSRWPVHANSEEEEEEEEKERRGQGSKSPGTEQRNNNLKSSRTQAT